MADVRYEHEMLAVAADRVLNLAVDMRAAEDEGDDETLGRLGIDRNAWVEVYLLHLRNLAHFYGGRPRHDDVVASHYAESWTAADGGDDLKDLQLQVRSHNKRLAHITAYRQRVPKDDDARMVTANAEPVGAGLLGVVGEGPRRAASLVPPRGRRGRDGAGPHALGNTSCCGRGFDLGGVRACGLVPVAEAATRAA